MGEEHSPKNQDTFPSDAGGRHSEADFRVVRRRNETPQSTADPEARPAKGKEARLCFGAHVLMDNRETMLDERHPPARARERDAGLAMLEGVPSTKLISVVAD